MPKDIFCRRMVLESSLEKEGSYKFYKLCICDHSISTIFNNNQFKRWQYDWINYEQKQLSRSWFTCTLYVYKCDKTLTNNKKYRLRIWFVVRLFIYLLIMLFIFFSLPSWQDGSCMRVKLITPNRGMSLDFPLHFSFEQTFKDFYRLESKAERKRENDKNKCGNVWEFCFSVEFLCIVWKIYLKWCPLFILIDRYTYTNVYSFFLSTHSAHHSVSNYIMSMAFFFTNKILYSKL